MRIQDFIAHECQLINADVVIGVAMIVIKFGGSSLADEERIRRAGSIIKQSLEQKPVVVLSAMRKTTDTLLKAGELALNGKIEIDEIRNKHLSALRNLGLSPELAKPLLEDLEKLLKGIAMIGELSPRTKDHLVSFGERLSVRIMSAYLNSIGINARCFDAWDVGFRSNSNFVDAELLDETYSNIASWYVKMQECVPVVTGFLAKDRFGNITTLGRGGSDLTASVIGSALKAEEIQFWKDVDGIMTADPRIVTNAKPVKKISFEEASELAYFGAKVLHPRSIIPAMNSGIPVRVKNSYNISHPGTVIVSESDNSFVKVINLKKNVTIIDIVSTRMLGQHGFLAKIFQEFAELGISVDMIASSEVSISLTLDKETEVEELKNRLERIAKVSLKKNNAIISIIGNIQRSSEILENALHVLNSNNIGLKMISQGASKVNIGFIIESSEAERCVNELHKAFFETIERKVKA